MSADKSGPGKPVAQAALRFRTLAYRVADIAAAGFGGLDPGLLRAELLTDHRVRSRRFIAELVPQGGRGAEIGVFTGLFSPLLLEVARPCEAWFVDVWWEEFGEHYPDWGAYTANGRLGTRAAHRAAVRRIARAANGAQCHVTVGLSGDFLTALPPGHLDWAYLDTGHSAEETREELALLASRIRPGGVLIGDDWYDDPAHPHHGVALAGREAVAAGRFELIGCYAFGQYALRATGR